MRRKHRLLLICALYLLMLPGFAFVYQHLYESDRASFAFNADVVIAQVEQVKRVFRERTEENDRLLPIVDALLVPDIIFNVREIEAGFEAFLTTIETSSGLTFELFETAMPFDNHLLMVYGTANRLLGKFVVDGSAKSPRTSHDVRNLLIGARLLLRAESQRIREA